MKSPDLRSELHAYIVGTLKPIERPSLIVRSVEDHLHCLLQLSRTVTIAKGENEDTHDCAEQNPLPSRAIRTDQ